MKTCSSLRLSASLANNLKTSLDLFFQDFKPYYGTRDVTRVGQRSMAIGINRRYSSPTVTINMRLFRKKGVPELVAAIGDILRTYDPGFTYTSIQINENFPGNLHVDRSNAGDSRMLVVGDDQLRGGELWCGGRILPTNKRMIAFDGNVPHMTLPYVGNVRYSVVLFTYAQICRNGGSGQMLVKARSLGIRSPAKTNQVCRVLKQRSPKGDLIQKARKDIAEHIDGIRRQCQVPLGSLHAFSRALEQRTRSGKA